GEAAGLVRGFWRTGVRRSVVDRPACDPSAPVGYSGGVFRGDPNGAAIGHAPRTGWRDRSRVRDERRPRNGPGEGPAQRLRTCGLLLLQPWLQARLRRGPEAVPRPGLPADDVAPRRRRGRARLPSCYVKSARTN